MNGRNQILITSGALVKLAADLAIDLEVLRKVLSVELESMVTTLKEISGAFSLVHKSCQDFFEKEPITKTTYRIPRYRYIPDKRRHHCMTRRTC